MRLSLKLVLYNYWRSSASFRVRIALAVKKLAYDSVAVNLLKSEQRTAEHRARSPMGHVPCLFIDGQPFIESVAIIELLDDLAPDPPLYPRDPYARARVRALVEMVNSGMQPLQNLVVLDRVSADAAARKEWSTAFNVRGLEALEALMKRHEDAGITGPYAFGDRFTAADVFLVPQLYAATRVLGIDLAPYPRVKRANEAALLLDAVKAAIPDAQPDAPK